MDADDGITDPRNGRRAVTAVAHEPQLTTGGPTGQGRGHRSTRITADERGRRNDGPAQRPEGRDGVHSRPAATPRSCAPQAEPHSRRMPASTVPQLRDPARMRPRPPWAHPRRSVEQGFLSSVRWVPVPRSEVLGCGRSPRGGRGDLSRGLGRQSWGWPSPGQAGRSHSSRLQLVQV